MPLNTYTKVKITTFPLGESTKPGNYYVYILFHEYKIVYVGLTGSIRVRINEHNQNKIFNTVLAIKCDDLNEAVFLEKDLILSILPKYNHVSRTYCLNRYKERRDLNLRRWNYYNENKHKPSSESDIYQTKHGVIILKKGLITDLDISRYNQLQHNQLQ